MPLLSTTIKISLLVWAKTSKILPFTLLDFSPGVIVTELQKRGGLTETAYAEVRKILRQ